MKPNVICTTIFGSRLYGTSVPESDYDYKGIYLPTAEQILDQEVPGTWSEKTNKSDSGRKSGPEDSETELFSLGKFVISASKLLPKIPMRCPPDQLKKEMCKHHEQLGRVGFLASAEFEGRGSDLKLVYRRCHQHVI